MRAKFTTLAVALCLVSLAGCQPRTAPPLPTPVVVRVSYTPALAPVLKTLHTCASQVPGSGVIVSEIPAAQLEKLPADLQLRLGQQPAAGGFSAQIGEDEVIVIVNPTNQHSLDLALVREIFTGQVGTWGTGTDPIHVWSYAPGDDILAAFERTWLQDAAITARAAAAPGPEAMLAAVASDPQAVGFLPRSALTGKVQAAAIHGFNPGTVPQLALSTAEPQGDARAILACLQGEK